ncbi:MAG: hypothetical protein A2166_02610 [Omnitrophica WOR_2 bacterium RBG_13_41_10]|nr:MAG: hypothetical protein A2166_02610 [Omnitrophica WOR_2 bacterium RBG_13_41_10]
MKARTKLLMLKGALTKKVPIYVQFAVSNRCNLRCSMCSALDSRKAEQELGLPEIERLAGILKELDVAILILTGGEPLLRNDLAEIIRLFARRGLEVRLQTNGILINESKVKELTDAGLKEVTISFDSFDAKKYDEITSVNGSWDKIIQGIALFSQYLPKKGNISGINTVVSKKNIEEVPKLIEFATRIGFYISLIPVHISGSNDKFIVRKDAPDFRFNTQEYEVLDRIYAKIVEMKREGFNVYNSYRFLSESKEFLKSGQVNWHCDSPFLYFSISPAGNFLPCVDIPTSISMLEDDFVQKFRSKEFINSIRDMVNKCSGCMYGCYPEVTYFCNDVKVFMERAMDGIRMQNSRRKPYEYNELLGIIEEIKAKEA